MHALHQPSVRDFRRNGCCFEMGGKMVVFLNRGCYNRWKIQEARHHQKWCYSIYMKQFGNETLLVLVSPNYICSFPSAAQSCYTQLSSCRCPFCFLGSSTSTNDKNLDLCSGLLSTNPQSFSYSCKQKTIGCI